MENTNNSEKVIGALLIGTMVGGVLGILFAPEKGSDTRKRITSKADDFTSGLQDKFNSFLDEAKKEFQTVKEKTIEFSEDGKEK